PRLISGGALRTGTEFKIATSGAWKDENTFELMLRYYETPHHDTLTCGFDGDHLTINFLSSIAAKNPAGGHQRPVVQGTLGCNKLPPSKPTNIITSAQKHRAMNPPAASTVRFVLFATSVTAIGGFLFGYDTAVINGANSYLKAHMSLSPAQEGMAGASAIL